MPSDLFVQSDELGMYHRPFDSTQIASPSDPGEQGGTQKIKKDLIWTPLNYITLCLSILKNRPVENCRCNVGTSIETQPTTCWLCFIAIADARC